MHQRALAAFVFCLLAAVAGAQVPGLGTYTYDPSGNVTSVGTHTFRYDAFGRIAKATLSPQHEQTSTYDRYGNLQRIDTKLNGTTLQAQQPAVNPCTNRIEVPPPGGTGCTTPAGYNVVGTYDAAGNVLSLEGNSFEYDVLNTTTASTVGGVRRVHLYSASGERVATATMTGGFVQRWDYTLRDASNRVLRRLSQQGGVWRWEEDYIYAGGKLIAAAVRSPEKVLHFHGDHLGTPRLVTGNGGARVTANNYFPFGRELPPAGTSASATPPFDDALKFTGHERDAATLDYMHARYYAPYLGRFLSVDPVIGHPYGPQSWNRYAYALNNPLAYADPRGRKPCKVTGSDGVERDGECIDVEGEVPEKEPAPPPDNWLSERIYDLQAAISPGSRADLDKRYAEWHARNPNPQFQNGTVMIGSFGNVAQTLPKLSGFTKHAINQAISRDGTGVASKAILDALTNPIKIRAMANGTTQIVGKDATIVVNELFRAVTIWARSSAGWRVVP